MKLFGRKQPKTPSPLQNTSIRGVVNNVLAEITVEQCYANVEKVNIEATYTFPLPLKAVLLSIEIEAKNQLLVGTVSARKAAEEKYEDAITDGDTAMMVRQVSPGLFNISVGNIQPSEHVVIRYRYALLLHWIGDITRLLIPTTIADRYGDPAWSNLVDYEVPLSDLSSEHRFTLNIDLIDDLADSSVQCVSHSVKSQRKDQSLSLNIQGEHAYMDRDIVLTFSRPSNIAPFRYYKAHDQYSQTSVGMLIVNKGLQASVTKKNPIALTVLIDCSGSMTGDSIHQARQALDEIIDQLSEDDMINIIRFGSHVSPIFEEERKLDRGHRNALNRLLKELNADMGGTEMAAAIAAVTPPIDGKHIPVALLITDGEVWGEDKLIALAEATKRRFFTVGVGSSVSEGLVRGIAEATNGACELLTPNETMLDGIARQFQRMRTPPQTVALDWGSDNAKQIPSKLPHYFDGDTLYAFAQNPGKNISINVDGNVAISVKATQDKTPEQNKLISDDALVRIAAFEHHKELTDDEEMRSLACQYQLLTDQTAMTIVAKSEEDQKPVDLPKLCSVKHMQAAGQAGYGSITAPIINHHRMASGSVNYDIPTTMRSGNTLRKSSGSTSGNSSDLDYLDIPAFLRRQADDNDVQQKTSEPASQKSAQPRIRKSAFKSEPRLYGWKKFAKQIHDSIVNDTEKELSITSLQSMVTLGLPEKLKTGLQSIINNNGDEYAIVANFIAILMQQDANFKWTRPVQRLIRRTCKVHPAENLVIEQINKMVTDYIDSESAIDEERKERLKIFLLGK